MSDATRLPIEQRASEILDICNQRRVLDQRLRELTGKRTSKEAWEMAVRVDRSEEAMQEWLDGDTHD